MVRHPRGMFPLKISLSSLQRGRSESRERTSPGYRSKGVLQVESSAKGNCSLCDNCVHFEVY